MEEDIVLVTIQYRLNVFGFMSTEDSTSPGNYGSLDQVEALKWIQENIAAIVLVVYSDPNITGRCEIIWSFFGKNKFQCRRLYRHISFEKSPRENDF